MGKLVLGCGFENKILIIPIKKLTPLLDKLNRTERENGKYYWHIHVSDQDGEFILYLKKEFENISLNQYLLSIEATS